MRSSRACALVLVLALVASGLRLGHGQAALAADTPRVPASPYIVGNAQVRVLPKGANGRDYQLYVALPASYGAQPDRRYPVLYVCDGYWDFQAINGFYGGLVYDKDAPEIIIVGFGYPGANPDFGALRAFDYTPVPDLPADGDSKRTGHAAEFLRAIETEFIPFIEREYRTDKSFRVLGGSSLGGLFTLYAMLERPGLFQGYIAPSPAVAWAKDWLLAREATFATTHKDLPARVFISGASEEDPAQLAAMKRFHGQLQSHSYNGLHVRWHLVQGERHAGTKPESYNRGLRFIFAPLAPRPNDK